MALTVFADGTSQDPSDLLDHRSSVRSLESYLTSRFIPAAVALHPRDRRGRFYAPAVVVRWLRSLAKILGENNIDIRLDRLWAADKQAQLFRAHTALNLLSLGFIYFAWASGFSSISNCWECALDLGEVLLVRPSPSDVIRAALTILLWPVLAYLAVREARKRWPRSKGLQPARPGFQSLGYTLLVGAVVWVVLSIRQGLNSDQPLLVATIAMAAFGLYEMIPHLVSLDRRLKRFQSPSTPRDVVGADLAASFAIALPASIFFGVWFLGLNWPDTFLALAIFTVAGTSILASSSMRYFLTLLIAKRTQVTLPLRLARFLDWCYEAGLLRLSGTAYQFRHLEMQRWLLLEPDRRPGTLGDEKGSLRGSTGTPSSPAAPQPKGHTTSRSGTSHEA